MTINRTSRVIGVTGGMGTGKSTVAGFLAAHAHAALFDADAVARNLLEPGAPGWQAFADAFGAGYFQADGNLDRVGVRQRLFDDPDFRQALDAVLHPLVRSELHLQVDDQVRRQPSTSIYVEVPLLFEAGWQNDFERVILVYAPCPSSISRLMVRDGIDSQEALRSIRAQMPLREKVARADHVVDNSGSWLLTRLQCRHLLGVLQRAIEP